MAAQHSYHKVDQKEYLKKYLSGDKDKKKKKDKKHKHSSSSSVRVKIIDDDAHYFDNGPQIDEELLLAGDDAPQIVGEYIDDRFADRNVPKWKSIVKDERDDGRGAIRKSEAGYRYFQSDRLKVKQEYGADRKYSNRSPDISPPRRNERKRRTPTPSPPRRRRRSVSPQAQTRRYKSPFRHESPSWQRKIKTEPQSSTHKKPFHNPFKTQNNERKTSFDSSPPRRRRNSDQSPPRRRNSDQSPPRRRRSKSPPIVDNRKRSPYRSSPVRGRNFDLSLRKGESFSRNTKSHSTYESPSHHRRNLDRSPPPRRDRSQDQLRPNKSFYPPPSETRRSPILNNGKMSRFLSPKPRRRASDQSPPRRNKRIENSPPRHRNLDMSPPRRDNKGRDFEQFPTRKFRNSSDRSPPRRNRISPDRKRRKTPDFSPPRKSRRSPIPSPPRRRKSPIDLSPRRIKREKRSPDSSPQARRSRWQNSEPEKSLSPPPTHKPKPGRTLEGKKAGLQDAKALHKESLERRKQEDLLFEKMSSDISGRNAEIQVRSTGRKGRRAREAREEDPEERRRKEEHEQKKKLLYDRWGKGLKQIEDHKSRMIEQEYESSKPLARYSNDEDLERHLREQERVEDPMLEYMRAKRKEKEKQSGKPQIPRYEGTYPENRFGIRPGYRWDGVDRSNGYEKKYFSVQNEKQARRDEAYKYSVEDM